MEDSGARGAAGSRTAGAYVLRRTAQEVRIWKRRECIAGGGAHASKKLLAALAVLAVALIALTAVSAVASESDADGGAVAPSEGATEKMAGHVISLTVGTGDDAATTYYTNGGFEELVEEMRKAKGDVEVTFLDDFTPVVRNEFNQKEYKAYFGELSDIGKNLVIDGNNKVLSGLVVPLIGGVYDAAEKVEIKNLTIERSKIESVYVPRTGVDGVGAFIGAIGNGNDVSLNGCKVQNGVKLKTVDALAAGPFAGGLVGYISSNKSVSITGCEVVGVEIESKGGQVGGLIGHNYSTVSISKSKVNQCVVTDAAEEDWQAGLIIGCNNGANVTVVDSEYDGNEIAKNSVEYRFSEGYEGLDFVAGYNIGSGNVTVDGEAVPADSYGETPEFKSAAKPYFDEKKNVVVTVANPLTVPAGVALNGDVALTEKNAGFTLEKGAVFNGKLSYTVEGSTGYAVFKNLKAGEDGIGIIAGSLTISGTIDATEPVEITAAGEIKISGQVVDTSSGSATTSGGLTITSDGEADTTVTVTGTLIVAEGATLTVAPGATLDVQGTVRGSGTVAVVGTLNNNGTVGSDVAVTVEVGATIGGDNAADIPNVTYADGAVKTVIIAGGEIADAKYGVQQKVEVTADTTVTGDLEISGVLHVNPGVTLTIASTGSVIIKGAGTSVIEGKLVLEAGDDDITTDDDASLTVDGTAILQIKGDLSVAGDVTAGEKATIQFMAGTSEVGGTFSAEKAVIDEGACLTVAGKIANVNASTPTTFEVAGKLIVDSDEVSDDFTVMLTSEEAKFNAERITMAKNGTVTVKDQGKVAIGSKDGKKIDSESVVSNGFTIEVDSVAGKVLPEGTIADPATLTDRAVLSGLVVKDSVKTATIDDKDGDGKKETVYTYTLVISGTVSIDQEIEYDGVGTAAGYATAEIDVLAGTAVAVKETLTLGAGIAFEIYGSLDVQAAVDATKTAEVTYVGTATPTTGDDSDVGTPALLTKTLYATVSNSGKITLSDTGSVTTYRNEITTIDTDHFDGASYKTGSSTSGYTYHYVTIDAAIDALGAGTTDKVSLFGTQTLTSDATILSKDTITLEIGARLVIGEKAGDDVTLTVADGGVLKVVESGSKPVKVNGTLKAEIYKQVVSIEPAIDSAVYSYAVNDKGKQDNSSWAEWTNLSRALDKAVSGDRVVVNKNTDSVDIGKDSVVKAGVVLVANGKTINVAKKTTLTIDGTLDLTVDGSKLVIAGAVRDGDRITEAAGKIDYAVGSIAYTGAVADRIVKNDFLLSGAYYTVTADGKTVSYIASYATGAAAAATADGQNVRFDADGATAGVVLSDIAISGSAEKPVTVEVVGSKLTAGTVTLSYAAIGPASGIVSATFASADGSVKVAGEAAGLEVSHGAYGSDETAVAVLQISGTLADVSESEGVAGIRSAVALGGNVYIVGSLQMTNGTIAVSEGAEVSIVKGDADADVDVKALVIAGNLTVASGSVVSAETTVSGALAVKGGEVALTTVTVTGSIDASEKNSSGSYAGEVKVGVLYADVDEKVYNSEYTGADGASIAGNVVLSGGTSYAVVKTGTDVPEAWTKDGYRSTAYTVGNASYVTVYVLDSNNTTEIGIIAFPEVENAVVTEWVVGNDNAAAKKIGENGFTAVAAMIKTDIYAVSIKADGGVNYITIDGVLLTKDSSTNVFITESNLVAGTHKVVISAVSGYDISKVVLYDGTGAELGAFTDNSREIALSGTPSSGDVMSVSYSLIGSTAAAPSGGSSSGGMSHDDAQGIIDAIDKNTDAVKNQPAGAAADNSLTNILLIVLVVLIVIMAALVAMRMMRS